jgi:hypothetical protein
MRRRINKALGAFFAALTTTAGAGGLPEATEVTPENAASYEIEVSEEPAASYGEKSFSISFPSEAQGGCSLGRIQTAIFDSSGRQISISSFDTSVSGASGSLLVGYSDPDQSMSVGLQYCCKKPDFACEIMFSIESLEPFSHNKSLKYVPALRASTGRG